MMRRPPTPTPLYSSAASDVYKRQGSHPRRSHRDHGPRAGQPGPERPAERRADPERHERPCAGSEDGHQPAVRGDGPEQRADRAAAAALDRPDGRVTATDRPAALAAVEDLVAVMDRLRSPGGCPWDAAQTHASLLPDAVEEVYEVVEAVENDDRTALCEELGDLLLQVVFHARVAQEHQTEPFGLAEVAAGVAAKLRHRHPHVFGDAVVADAEDVHRRWEEIKKAEKARASVLDGIPAGLPSSTDARAFSAFLISSQRRWTSSASATTASPKTCGCRCRSLAATPAATSASPNGSVWCSWATRAWKTTWSSRSPSSSHRAARSSCSTASTTS